MEIGASLLQLELSASDPDALAAFYASTFGLKVSRRDDALECVAPGRALKIVAGAGGQLRRASFRFQTQAQFDAHRDAVAATGLGFAEREAGHHSLLDPEGRLVTFLAPAHGLALEAAHEAARTAPQPELEARLQHFAVRTPSPAVLADFYTRHLGFVLSDRVLDEQGDLTAAFLRTDSEHHAMAIFRAPMVRFDHFSCEAPDWHHLRDWADHMAEVGVDLAWGIGRHGPGNDTFLMVQDMDGNMGEISCDLEVCAPDRPAGTWSHRPQTLNRWGVAIMRS